ncbi:hypothetical protein ACIREO_35175 [Streptomyces sp. NPDC102441]|uniref:hypothetical protein n=1 Tax=Streptomyces sp. NPDC102441 TaxID=3366176 RepID=UPI0037F54915
MNSESLSSDGRRVRDLVREVVADLAPEELLLVQGLFELDDATAVRRLAGWGRRREPLGFGMTEIAVLITPVVWLTLDQAARHATDILVDSTTQRSTTLLRRLFRRSQEPAVVPPLTRDQLAEIRRTVMAAADQCGLSAERATQIADAVVSRLVLAEPDAPDEATPDTTPQG